MPNVESTRKLAEAFAPVVSMPLTMTFNIENLIRIGVDGPRHVGKSQFCSTLIESLGGLNADKDTLGTWRTAFSENAGLIRHYDAEGLPLVANNLELLSNSKDLKSHLDFLQAPRSVGGLDIVEHANQDNNQSYRYMWDFKKESHHELSPRTSVLSVSEKDANSNEFRNFLSKVEDLLVYSP